MDSRFHMEQRFRVGSGSRCIHDGLTQNVHNPVEHGDHTKNLRLPSIYDDYCIAVINSKPLTYSVRTSWQRRAGTGPALSRCTRFRDARFARVPLLSRRVPRPLSTVHRPPPTSSTPGHGHVGWVWRRDHPPHCMHLYLQHRRCSPVAAGVPTPVPTLAPDAGLQGVVLVYLLH